MYFSIIFTFIRNKTISNFLFLYFNFQRAFIYLLFYKLLFLAINQRLISCIYESSFSRFVIFLIKIRLFFFQEAEIFFIAQSDFFMKIKIIKHK